MFQVRFHGRGGQGVVTAAELLAEAAFIEGRHAQAFPSFGSERMGAPVMSFCRIDDKPIRTHEPVTEPDALIIQDPTLLHQADLFGGLGHDGYILVNSTAELRRASAWRSSWPACRTTGCWSFLLTQLAMTHLGRPLPGAPHARRVRRADRRGRPGLGARRYRRQVRRAGRQGKRRRGPGRVRFRHRRAEGTESMLKQMEGSQAVAEAVAHVPPGGDLRLPDHPADAHRRGAQRHGQTRRPERRVPQRGVGVRRPVGGHRGVRGRRPRLHRDRQPGPALHERSGVQRGRPRAADRDDGRPTARSARRSTSGTTTATRCRSATPAGSSSTPRPTRKPWTCTSRRSGSPKELSRPGDGVHGRLPAHPRQRAGRHPRPGPGGRVPAAVRPAPGARPGRAGLDRRHGRPRGVHRGPLPGLRAACSRPWRSSRRSRRSSPRSSAGTPAAWSGLTSPTTRRSSWSRSARCSAPSRTSSTNCAPTE